MTAVEKKQKGINPTKVAIVGSAPTRMETPWGDPDFDVWGLAWRGDLLRCDRRFDIHTMDLSKRRRVSADYIDRLAATTDCVIYLQQEHPLIPQSVAYPLMEVQAYLKKIDDYASVNYFSSSIGYMLALALTMDWVQEIHLYGIDLIDDEEYGYQRPNAEYLVGLARGLGKKVFIPDDAAICKFSHMYGYEDWPSDGLINREILKDRIRQYDRKHIDALAAAYTADGAKQEAHQLLKMLERNSRGVIIKDPTHTKEEK